MRALSLGYHDVDDLCALPPHRRIYVLERARFESHLDAIRRVAAGRVRTVDSLGCWDVPAPTLLTFDDGNVSALYVADQLEIRGWRGHFFIVTDWIGRSGYLQKDQIRDLASRGHVIGSHTCSHPEFMSALSFPDLLREWSASCAVLADLLGDAVTVASVANGFDSAAVRAAATAAGIRTLFNSRPTTRVEPIPGGLLIGRFAMQRDTPADFAGALAAGRAVPRLRESAVWGAKAVLKTLAGEHYLRIRHALLAGTRS